MKDEVRAVAAGRDSIRSRLSSIADQLQDDPDERAQEAYPHVCTALGVLGAKEVEE